VALAQLAGRHHGLEADFYFPAYRLVIETAGWATHRTRRAFESDRARTPP
jgi:very-short-patch-repair endonuclease